jgi:hypothetical protein
MHLTDQPYRRDVIDGFLRKTCAALIISALVLCVQQMGDSASAQGLRKHFFNLRVVII